MDAINKFTGIQQTFVSESQEVQSESLNTPEQVPTTGISGIADGFENFQQAALDRSNLTNPAATTQDNSVVIPAETFEASSLFDVLNSDNSFAPGEALGKKLPPDFADIRPGDALGKKLPPASYSILPGDAPEKKLPPTIEALPKKLEPAETVFKSSIATGANSRRLSLTEQNLNEFIQKHLSVADQVPVTQNLKNWIKSTFRLSPAQQTIVDSLSHADIQRAQKAAMRAAELNQKLSVEFRDPAFDQQFFVLNKDQQGEVDTLQLEENNNSVVLKHVAGCRPEIISQMQEQLKTKTTLS